MAAAPAAPAAAEVAAVDRAAVAAAVVRAVVVAGAAVRVGAAEDVMEGVDRAARTDSRGKAPSSSRT